MPNLNEITSFSNPRVKEVVKLRERSVRDKMNLMIVEGLRETMRGFDAGIYFKDLYFSKNFFEENQHDSFIQEACSLVENVFLLKKDIFEKISFGNRKEGILAICKQPEAKFSDLKLSSNPLLVVVESLEKPGNLGAILRTCDGAGVEAVIVCDEVADIYNPNVIRSSTGVIFSVPVIKASSQETVKFLKENKIIICATFLGSEKEYTKINMKNPLAVVAGSEKNGLDDFWRNSADEIVSISMRGKADSLNVSVATSIILYEAIRQRNI